MTARNTIHATLDKLRQQSRRTGQVRLPARALELALRAAIHLLLAAGAPALWAWQPGAKREEERQGHGA